MPEEQLVQPRPGRAVLRIAGLLTQLACAGCLLLGTIAFVMVHQNKTGGTGYVVGWAVTAMLGLVFGGLMARGGLIAILGSALLDIGLGVVLLVLDHATLTRLLRALADSDVEMVGDALVGGAIALIVIGALCFASIPQGIRYTRWLHAGESGDFAAASAAETDRRFPPPPEPGLVRPRITNRGFAPPQIPGMSARSSMWRPPTAPAAERRSRRRMYFALGGFAIGFGAGIGVLVSSTTRSDDVTESGDPDPGPSSAPGDAGPSNGGGLATRLGRHRDAGVASGDDGGGGGSAASAATSNVRAMLQTQRDAIARGDLDGLVATVWPDAIGFGVDGDELLEGRAAFAAQVAHDLGDLGDGTTVEVTYSHVGEDGDHAWIAEHLELASPRGKRRFAITELAAVIDGAWKVVAWHWAVPVPDATAERVALLGTKPLAKAIASKLDGPKAFDKAVRAAFSSREAFVTARSTREDAFNFGSAPGERIVGGDRIAKIFGRLRARIRLHDGVRALAANAWNPANKSPEVGVALVNADFTSKTRAATDLTQTFRVMAVFVREGSDWKIVLTQWSHAGPIRN